MLRECERLLVRDLAKSIELLEDLADELKLLALLLGERPRLLLTEDESLDLERLRILRLLLERDLL